MAATPAKRSVSEAFPPARTTAATVICSIAMLLYFPIRQTQSLNGTAIAVLPCIACALFWSCSVGRAVGQMSPPSRSDVLEGQFLTQLLDRQLHELAENYCLDRLDIRRDTESLAFWTDQLCTAYRKHTWLESRPNRTAITQTAVRTVTSFLAGHVVSPVAELTLRLNQIETLLNLIQIDSYLMRVGHSGPRRPHQFPHLDGLNARIAQANELIADLTGQLSRVGRQLDRTAASRLRERARRVSTELETLRVQINREETTSAMKELYRLERSARMDTTRWTAITLQAELQLLSGDYDRNELTLRRLIDQFPDRADEQTQLRVRRLLRKGQPTDALTLIENIHPHSAAARSHAVDVLKLESLLQLRRLAGQLQDADLIQKTDAHFDKVAEHSAEWTPSVQRDAAQSLMASYRLVRTVGYEVAGLIEHVELLHAGGEHENAIHELRRALKLLRPDTSLRSQGAIYLAIGELHVSQESWDSAIASLQLAERHFRQAKLAEFASRADLLHAFCIGQQWRADPSNPELHTAYVDALTLHCSQWPDQKSWATATDWLIQVLQQTDPIHACEVLQEVVERSEETEARITGLVRWGSLIDRERTASLSTQSTAEKWASPVESFLESCRTVKMDSEDLESDFAVLRLIQLCVETGPQTSWEQWSSIAEELPSLRRRLTAPDEATKRRLSELQLLASSRTSTDHDLQDQIQKVFLKQHSEAPLASAQRLSQYLTTTGLILPGDTFLAKTIEELIRREIKATNNSSGLLAMFSLACTTRRMSRDPNLRNELLSRLLEKNLTAEEVRSLAVTLMASCTSTESDAAGELLLLWDRIHSDSPEGSDLWLESCLQIAELRSQRGQGDKAAQQLRVTSVLYPKWGAQERLDRVNKLLDRLQSHSEVD